MKERKEFYKCFAGKDVRVVTRSNFTFSSSNIEIVDTGILFKDKFNCQKFIPFDEIKFIEEVSNGY